MPDQYTISGSIDLAGNPDRRNFRVQAFDRDLPSLERRAGGPAQLGHDALTDGEGRFQITYSAEQFSAGDGATTADVSFRVFDPSGRELAIRVVRAPDREYRGDQVIFNVPNPFNVTLSVESVRQGGGGSEYELLLAAVSALIAPLGLTEMTDEDVAFLGSELGYAQQEDSRQRLEWLRRSALLAAQSSSPAEAFYGWGRKGLPAALPDLIAAPLSELPKIFAKLSATASDKLRDALLVAIADNIISAGLRDRAAAIAAALHRGAQQSFTLSLRLQATSTAEPLPGYAVTTLDVDRNDARRRSQQCRSAGFAFLLSIRSMTRSGQPVIDLEWATVYDTLLLARKQHEFGAWRTEEQGLGSLAFTAAFQVERQRARSGGEPVDSFLALDPRSTALLARRARCTNCAAGVRCRRTRNGRQQRRGGGVAARAQCACRRVRRGRRFPGRPRGLARARVTDGFQDVRHSTHHACCRKHRDRAGAAVWLAHGPARAGIASRVRAARIAFCRSAGRGAHQPVRSRVRRHALASHLGWRLARWVSLGPLPGAGVGIRPSNPVAMAYPDGRLDVIVSGADRVLWQKRYDQGWRDWARVSDDLELTGNIAIADLRPGPVRCLRASHQRPSGHAATQRRSNVDRMAGHRCALHAHTRVGFAHRGSRGSHPCA